MSSPEILVLYYSRHGATQKLARLITEGIESVSGIGARIRTVPAISAVCEATEPAYHLKGLLMQNTLILKNALVLRWAHQPGLVIWLPPSNIF